MSLAIIYVEIAILIIGIVVLAALFAFRAPPFNEPYKYRNPRTWQPVNTTQTWFQPAFDYGPFQRDIPTNSQVSAIYTKFDPTRDITSNSQYAQSNPPTESC